MTARAGQFHVTPYEGEKVMFGPRTLRLKGDFLSNDDALGGWFRVLEG